MNKINFKDMPKNAAAYVGGIEVDASGVEFADFYKRVESVSQRGFLVSVNGRGGGIYRVSAVRKAASVETKLEVYS